MKYFDQIEKVRYEGKDSKNKFAFKHYNPDEVIDGKPMKEHLRFAVAYWHTMTENGKDPFGVGTYIRDWETEDPLETAKNRVNAFFEILDILDVDYFCFHDVDIAPQGDSLEEFFDNLDVITDLIKEKMNETGKKLLWNTANLFSHPRYVNGGPTSNNAEVYAIAAAQVKKGLDISKKLNGENYVFWGGREGYESLLNTDMDFELDNIARFFKMAISYGEKIGHKPQFLLEPKPKEPMKHQYDFDAATTMAFIQKYGLEGDFKLNLEANHATLAGHTFEHEISVARSYDALGSLDANQGDELLGWDTDEFPTNIYTTTLAMHEVLENGGIAPGGINFDAKPRRTSFEMEDILLTHIVGMDAYARGLRVAAKMKEENFFEEIIKERYSSFESELGKRILNNEENLETLTNYALSNDDATVSSSHLEYIKAQINDYIF